MFVAAVTGILAIKLLKYVSKKANFKIFSIYCMAVGLLTVIFG
jgi:undecaprenyl pyrophosphate phosphatase UppP